ncbi:hypothetical protein QE152_g11269 [Popillia japonica]|uniref:Uncharacterized protein n=1 Tax=Popillia japonica TaxID=7064 RepID=A0AAW1LR59_POPJA
MLSDLHNLNNLNNEEESAQDTPLWLLIVVSIIHSLLITTYIIPNIFLITIFIKRQFYQQNLFYTIVHWSFANLLHIIFPIYVQYAPREYMTTTLTAAFLAVHCSISGIPLNMAMFWIFDKFIRSEKFCFKSIRNNWIMLILQIAILLALVFTNIFDAANIAIGYIVFSALTLIIFVSRLIRFWCKGSEEENYQLRAWMSGIFICSSFVFTIWLIIEVMLEIHVTGLIYVGLNVVLANGYVNVILLFVYDQNFNSIVKELRRKCCFGEKEATVVVGAEVEVAEVSFKSESDCELSEYYDEVEDLNGMENIGGKRSNKDGNVSMA